MTYRDIFFPTSQTSYAAVLGYKDTVRWWYSCGNQIPPDGVFGLDFGSKLAQITDGTSNTLLVGEASRFRNETEDWYNEWSSAIWWGSSIPGVSRFAAIATTAPRLNANLQIPDPMASFSYTGDVDSWVFDPNPAVNALNAGQFGFRSQHPSGANFLLGDGSVRFFKDSINPAVYQGISTKNYQEVISADSY